jgi:hypothetical protein
MSRSWRRRLGPEGAAEGRHRYRLAKAGAHVRPKAPGRRAGAKGRLSEAAPAERVRCQLAAPAAPKPAAPKAGAAAGWPKPPAAWV